MEAGSKEKWLENLERVYNHSLWSESYFAAEITKTFVAEMSCSESVLMFVV